MIDDIWIYIFKFKWN